MRRLPIVLVAVFLAGCGGDSQPLAPNVPLEPGITSPNLSSQGATVTVTERTINIYRTPYAACLGERLTITGTRYLRTRTTIDAAGGMHVHMLFNDRGWIAVGQTSGETWQLVAGMAPLSINQSGNTLQMTFTWSGGQLFRPDNPSMPLLQFHGPTHFTVNAQGEVTADFDKYEMFICQGS